MPRTLFEKIWASHLVAQRIDGRDDSTNPSSAAMREDSRSNNIKLFDIDDPEQGISHVVAPELGMVLPGATHAVPDSHASTVGGLGALAFGCGTTELVHILATQVIALKRPKSIRLPKTTNKMGWINPA
jgi:3-isopropylmalate/(R)-2-methylmalate dehydratase large subunit